MALATVAAVLPILELGLRWLYPSPTVYRPLTPGLSATFHLQNAHGVKGPSLYQINSMGARAREWGRDRRAEYRVLCMGGSATESLANDQSRTWTSLLEQALGNWPDGRRTWVGNIGGSGWSTRHHRTQARHLFEVYDPDAVVLLTGVNDLSSRLKQGDAYDPGYPDTARGAEALRRQSFAISPGRFADEWSYDPWVKRTRLWLLLRKARHRVWARPEAEQDARGVHLSRWRAARASGTRLSELPSLEAALDEYGRALREIVERARARGARILLASQPVLWKAGMSPEEEALLWMGGVGEFRTVPGSAYYEPAALARGMDAYNQRLLQVCAESGAECLDLAAQVPPNLENFYDDCHLTDAGQVLVAGLVAEALGRGPASGGSARVAAVAGGVHGDVEP
jgi:hypothetical protein